MFRPNYVSHSCNDGIPFELFIASNRGTNSVLLPVKLGYLQCLDLEDLSRILREFLQNIYRYNRHTFFGGPPEWKCGFRISFANSSKSVERVFRTDVIGVIRLIQRLFFCPGHSCAWAHKPWTSRIGSIDLSVRINVTKGSFSLVKVLMDLDVKYKVPIRTTWGIQLDGWKKRWRWLRL